MLDVAVFVEDAGFLRFSPRFSISLTKYGKCIVSDHMKHEIIIKVTFVHLMHWFKCQVAIYI